MVSLYIGLENELITYKNGNKIDFNKKFSKFKNSFQHYFEKTNTSIRTDTGHGYYVDGSEIEILTPPILINKGFSTRLANAWFNGYQNVVKNTKSCTHTGYSMHWNLSYDKTSKFSRTDFYTSISVPFQLFGLSPISCGFNLRYKREDGGRLELLGDSINNYDQVKATGLLLGASLLAANVPSFFKKIKFVKNSFCVGDRKNIFIEDGRYSSVFLKDGTNVPVQNYLEYYVKILKPFIDILATKEERKNLYDFVKMKKELEFDKFGFYSRVKSYGKSIDNKSYLPVEFGQNQETLKLKSSLLKPSPIECMLQSKLLELVPSKMEWGLFESDSDYISGVGDIYEFAKKKVGKKLGRTPEIKKIRIPNLAPDTISKISYSSENDSFLLEQSKSKYCLLKEQAVFFKNNFWEKFKKNAKNSPKFYCYSVLAAGAVYLVLSLGSVFRETHYENLKTNFLEYLPEKSLIQLEEVFKNVDN
jgi:hypothetical protein